MRHSPAYDALTREHIIKDIIFNRRTSRIMQKRLFQPFAQASVQRQFDNGPYVMKNHLKNVK